MKKDTEGIVILCDKEQHENLVKVWDYANEKLESKRMQSIGSIAIVEDGDFEKIFLMGTYGECDNEFLDIYNYANCTIENCHIWIIQGYAA